MEISIIICTVNTVESCTVGSNVCVGLDEVVRKYRFLRRTGDTGHGIDV